MIIADVTDENTFFTRLLAIIAYVFVARLNKLFDLLFLLPCVCLTDELEFPNLSPINQ